MSSECPRFNKWIRGCKFEPRYDKSVPGNGQSLDFRQGNALRQVTYVCDVCIHCGEVVAREAVPCGLP